MRTDKWRQACGRAQNPEKLSSQLRQEPAVWESLDPTQSHWATTREKRQGSHLQGIRFRPSGTQMVQHYLQVPAATERDLPRHCGSLRAPTSDPPMKWLPFEMRQAASTSAAHYLWHAAQTFYVPHP